MSWVCLSSRDAPRALPGKRGRYRPAANVRTQVKPLRTSPTGEAKEAHVKPERDADPLMGPVMKAVTFVRCCTSVILAKG